jgi:peptidyl-prolyl cis-trans isomerase C
MKITKTSLLIIGAALLAGCNNGGGNSTSGPSIDRSEAVAVVNDAMISKESLQMMQNEIAQRAPGRSIPTDMLIEELVQREILAQEAINKHLDQTPEFKTRLDSIKKSLLSQAAVQNYLKSNPITDADLKAEYEKSMGTQSGEEYKARHILVKTEDEAKAIIAELDKGADFAELAKKKSTGPSASQGGDLGWFSPQQMVPPFSEAVIGLDNGKYTETSVETQFGWHVILREDSRQKSPPAFDSVKEKMRPVVQRQKIKAYIDGLRNQAKIEILVSEPEPAAEEPMKVEPIKPEPVKPEQKPEEPAAEKSEPEQQPAVTEETDNPAPAEEK